MINPHETALPFPPRGSDREQERNEALSNLPVIRDTKPRRKDGRAMPREIWNGKEYEPVQPTKEASARRRKAWAYQK
jgi:hypothetical protein